MAWHLGGAQDEAALERALGEVVRRHEALRTTFAEERGTIERMLGHLARVLEQVAAGVRLSRLELLSDAERLFPDLVSPTRS